MRISRLVCAACVILLINQFASASAFVRGAYYRLGDEDSGAVAGALGNNPTIDSFSDHLDLSRFGTPLYSSDVPPNGPFPNKLSMAFSNNDNHNPFAYYGRSKALDMSQQGYALEAWVKAPVAPIDPGGGELIAYNGDPFTDGFGLFRDGDSGTYMFRAGSFSQELGPANDGAWHHLAYVRTFSNASYWFDGKLVKETTTDPAPLATADGFWIGGRTYPTGAGYVFNGLIDEVRYQTFNPLAAGAFDPTSFLITVPEPGTLSVLIAAVALLCNRRRHDHSVAAMNV
ncbi:MAG TPA: LamG domain-containing protein [Tepidisphaeraceae bacterium]|nr:LamG domain-containing protein [Tepidisphaeraceae bacterium]